MKRRALKRKIEFIGHHNDDSIMIGNHGDTIIKVQGVFDLSGIIYSPKYSVTLLIAGSGRIAFRGTCNQILIKVMKGDCTLDLSELSSKEVRCDALKGKARIIAGKTRLISRANLSEDAQLFMSEKSLITSSNLSDSSSIQYIQM